MFFSITITTSDALVGWSDERELLGFISTVGIATGEGHSICYKKIGICKVEKHHLFLDCVVTFETFFDFLS